MPVTKPEQAILGILAKQNGCLNRAAVLRLLTKLQNRTIGRYRLLSKYFAICQFTPNPFSRACAVFSDPQVAEKQLKGVNAEDVNPRSSKRCFSGLTKAIIVKNNHAKQSLHQIIGKS